MATGVKGLSGKEAAALVAAVIFGLNWTSATYLNFPFVWCWGQQFTPLFEPWLFLIHFSALVYFVLAVLSQSVFRIANAMFVAVIAFGLPMFMEILFRLEKSCG